MTAKHIPEIITEIARRLRQNMTEPEKILWNKLRNAKFFGKKFLRQSPIYVYTEYSGLDRFIIPDFVCKSSKLIVEIDGGVHSLKQVYLLDSEKETLLNNLGYEVLRFNNEDVLQNIDKVLQKISKFA